MIFYIKSRNKPVEFINGSKVFMSGEPSFISVTTPMRHEVIDAEKGIKQFRTGFLDSDILTNPEYTITGDEEGSKKLQKSYITVAKNLRDFISKAHNHAKDNTNSAFWNEYRTNLKITKQSLAKLHDTNTVEGAILYLSILGGGFPQVSMSEDLATTNQNRFYITSEGEFDKKSIKEKYGDKRKATVYFDKLYNTAGNSDLVYMSYLIPTLKENGFTFNSSKERLEDAYMEFIEGHLNKADKKKAAEDFIVLYEMWETDKEQLITKATIQAAIYFGLIYKQKGTGAGYVNGLTQNLLGESLEQIYSKLSKAENHEELTELVEATKEKLNK